MSLSTKGTGGGGGKGLGMEIATGVFVQPTHIQKVVNLSGKTLEHLEDKFDLAIEVFMDEPELSFTPSVKIFGNFARTGKKITGWGSAFKVGRFFDEVMGEATLNDDYTIPAEWLKKAKGMRFMKLIYAAGAKSDDPTKARLLTSDHMVSLEDKDEDAAAQFLSDEWHRQRAKGYPKNYNPVTFGDAQGPSAAGNYSRPDPVRAATGSADPLEGLDDPDDDDVPF